METTVRKKVLLYEHSQNITKKIGYLNSKLPKSQVISDVFNRLQLGCMQQPDLLDLLYQSGANIQKRYRDNILNQFNKAGISDHTILSNAIQAKNDVLNDLLRLVEDLRRIATINDQPELLDKLSFDSQGTVYISDLTKEEIRESERVYVATEEGFKVLELQRKAHKALNDYVKALLAGGKSWKPIVEGNIFTSSNDCRTVEIVDVDIDWTIG